MDRCEEKRKAAGTTAPLLLPKPHKQVYDLLNEQMTQVRHYYYYYCCCYCYYYYYYYYHHHSSY